MHMFSAEKRFLGGHGIVGGQVPLGTGVAFKIRYQDEDDICVCYFGDGASNQGQVFEAMNLAATWKLPVLYVIENNQFAWGPILGESPVWIIYPNVLLLLTWIIRIAMV